MPAWYEVAAVAAPEIVGSTVAADMAAEAALSEILAQQAAAAAISSSAVMGASSGAAGLGSLPGYEAFLEQLTAVNPEIAAQQQAFRSIAAVPPVTPTVAPMAKTAAQAAPFFPAGGMQAAAPVVGPGEAGWGMDLGANEIVGSGFVPSDARAFTPSVEGMIDQATGKALDSGFKNPLSAAYDWYKKQDAFTRYGIAGLGAMQAAKYLNKTPGLAAPEKYSGPLSKFTYDPRTYRPYSYRPYAAGGPVEQMSNENAIGANTGYPQADIQQGAYATPWQTPISRNVVADSGDIGVDQMTGLQRMDAGGAVRYANGGLYSDPYTNQYADPNSLMASGDSLYSNEGKGQSPGTSASGPGQGISNSAIGLGLGLMGLAESVPGIATGLAGLIGQSIADNQADAIGNSFSALSSIADTPGVTAVSDASGNVTGISTDAGIAAADAAAGLSGDSGDSGGDGAGGGDGGGGGGDGGGGFANGGFMRSRRYANGGQTYSDQNDPYGLLSLLYNPEMYGRTGAAMSAPMAPPSMYMPEMSGPSLSAPEMYSPSMYSPMMYSPSGMSSSLVDPTEAYAAAQPVMSLPQQNFENFLAQYQNLPGMTQQEITDWSAAKKAADEAAAAAAAPPTSGYNYDTGVPVGLGSNEAAYDSAAGSPGGGAKAGGLMRHMAMGGISNLGGYSDGGRLLKGPGDGMSDNIPASIGGKQPARLADGEFVVPADVVSGLGNGSTDAGAKHLYAMMDKVRSARTGTKKQGRQINPRKYLPA